MSDQKFASSSRSSGWQYARERSNSSQYTPMQMMRPVQGSRPRLSSTLHRSSSFSTSSSISRARAGIVSGSCPTVSMSTTSVAGCPINRMYRFTGQLRASVVLTFTASSEDEFQSKLNIAVLNPAVLDGGCIRGSVLTKTAVCSNNWSSRERAYVEIAVDDMQIRVVKEVVDLGTELKLQLLRYREILVN